MDLGQVFTKKEVADLMVSFLEKDADASLLDPCFGGGVFINSAIQFGYKDIDGYEIDRNLYEDVKGKHPFLNLRNENFLQASECKKYDGIVMNPPYIRHEKINDLESIGITKKILSEEDIFLSLPSSANLYMYFIIKSLYLLKNEGDLVVVFPSSWLLSKNGRSFEKTIYSMCSLIKQIHISGELFEKYAMVDVIVLHLRKSKIKYPVIINNASLINGVISFEENKEIEERLELGFSASFPEIAKIRRGLTTGNNEMFINPPLSINTYKDHIKKIISSPKSISGYSTINANLDNILLPDSDIDNIEVEKYIYKWRENILSLESPKTLFNKIKNGSEDWYKLKDIDSKGIVFSYFVRNDIKFIYNDYGHLVRDNFYIIYPKIDPLLAFALLNNYYTFYQLEKLGKKYGSGLLKLQKYDIEELVFPDINNFSKKDVLILKKLSEKLIKENYTQCINEITEVISSYSKISSSRIKISYFKVKSHRLGSKKNECS